MYSNANYTIFAEESSWRPGVLVIVSYMSGAYAGGGGGFKPPLLWLCHFFFFFLLVTPGGRSGRRTVPLPNNVNDVKNCKEKKKSPPPPPRSATFSGLARHRGICSRKHPPLKNPAYASDTCITLTCCVLRCKMCFTGANMKLKL